MPSKRGRQGVKFSSAFGSSGAPAEELKQQDHTFAAIYSTLSPKKIETGSQGLFNICIRRRKGTPHIDEAVDHPLRLNMDHPRALRFCEAGIRDSLIAQRVKAGGVHQQRCLWHLPQQQGIARIPKGVAAMAIKPVHCLTGDHIAFTEATDGVPIGSTPDEGVDGPLSENGQVRWLHAEPLRDQYGELPETVTQTGVYHNLLRMWADT
jgi:hypothetical protein